MLQKIKILKNLFHTIISNLTTLIVSFVLLLIVPKIFTIEEYGYWQIYLFYVSYVGIFQLGWGDGIYLRYGGKKYIELDKKELNAQIIVMTIFQIILSLLLYNFFKTTQIFLQKNVLIPILLNSIILNISSILIYILQATNRLKESANQNIIAKFLYIFLIISCIILGLKKYEYFIIADLATKFISLLILMYYCKDIIFFKTKNFSFCFKEILKNINAGIKIMIANIMGMLLIGVFRFGIEYQWDISTFGKISLIINISSFLMFFSSAMSVVIYPVLKKIKKEDYLELYEIVDNFLTILIFLFFIFYYPMKEILSIWLKNYIEVLKYLALIFPMILYEIKNSILINTFLKALRKEKILLKSNIVFFLVALMNSYISVKIFKNLNIVILLMVITLIFKTIIMEIYVQQLLNKKINHKIFYDLFLSIIFSSLMWYIKNKEVIYIYTLFYFIYIYINRKEIKRLRKRILIYLN